VAVLMLPASLILSGLLLDRASLALVTALTLACSAGVLLAESSGALSRRRRATASPTSSTPP
jgi:hypothetical protein